MPEKELFTVTACSSARGLARLNTIMSNEPLSLCDIVHVAVRQKKYKLPYIPGVPLQMVTGCTT